MPTERTLSIVKPDAVKKNLIGQVLSRLEKGELRIIACKMVFLTKDQAAAFYAVHKERGFYKDLITFMTSGPVVVSLLEGENAISKNREIMGATNPKDAKPGTIRAEFGESIDQNVVHGSDGPETAKTEIAFFFGNGEIFPRK